MGQDMSTVKPNTINATAIGLTEQQKQEARKKGADKAHAAIERQRQSKQRALDAAAAEAAELRSEEERLRLLQAFNPRQSAQRGPRVASANSEPLFVSQGCQSNDVVPADANAVQHSGTLSVAESEARSLDQLSALRIEQVARIPGTKVATNHQRLSPTPHDVSDGEVNEDSSFPSSRLEASEETTVSKLSMSKSLAKAADPVVRRTSDQVKRSAPLSKERISSLPKIQKRSQQPSAFSDDRRASASERRPSDVMNAASPSTSEVDGDTAHMRSGIDEDRPPQWYKDLSKPKTRDPKESSADILLARLKDQITKSKKHASNKKATTVDLNVLRDVVHKAIFQKVTAGLLRFHHMLDNDSGLPQLFDPGSSSIRLPFDIAADAKELYNKWCRKDFETNLLRGILTAKPKSGKDKTDRTGDRIDPKYRDTGCVPRADFHGNGHLVNGQWWPTQMTALRDGAHGSVQGGIYGRDGQGVFSCVMSGGLDLEGKKYPDEDHGEWVLYCGTDSNNSSVTAGTAQLKESHRLDKPVRLIRSHNIPRREDGGKSEHYAPEIGFRYDGLYNVAGVERMDPESSIRQRHRFRLVRLPGQDPIRAGDKVDRLAVRPNDVEMAEYLKDKHLRGLA